MAEKKITITSATGVHARPAGLFAQAAKAGGAHVTVRKAGGAEVDGTSILSVMSLGVTQGDEVTISVSGTDHDEDLVEELASILLAQG